MERVHRLQTEKQTNAYETNAISIYPVSPNWEHVYVYRSKLSRRMGGSRLDSALGGPCRSLLSRCSKGGHGHEFLEFLQPTISTFYMAVQSECGVPFPDRQAAYPPPPPPPPPTHTHTHTKEILRAALVIGGDSARPLRCGWCKSDKVGAQANVGWRSWPTNCKLFIWRWWEMSGRWGQVGSRWICPMRHGTLW